MILTARFVAPIDQPVIENGAVVIHDGLIGRVGRARELADRTAVDYGDAVICPGFVNAHTHLELTYLAGRVPPTPDFIDWLRRLYSEFVASPPTRESVRRSVEDGIRQSLALGVTTVGDITRHPAWTRDVIRQSPMRAVSFGEVIAIGALRGKLAERLHRAASREQDSDRLTAGLSPHAPYTVEPEGLTACAGMTHANRATNQQEHAENTSQRKYIPFRLCIHAAESRVEADFTRSRHGPFTSYLRDLDLWDDEIPVGGCGPIELLQRTGLLTPRTVLAHANYVTDEDISLIARGGASVAYCPRTHHAFGHPPHRFRDMLAAGINVGIGTDSLASNPSLSILDELRFLKRQHPGVSVDLLLELGTIGGARALGLDHVVGTLTPGKRADLVVFSLGNGRPFHEMLEQHSILRAVAVDGEFTSF